MFSRQMYYLGLRQDDMWRAAIQGKKGVFSASQVHRFYTSKTQAICPLTHPLTSLLITPKDYQQLYVY